MSIYETNTASAPTVELQTQMGRCILRVNGERYYVKGAGGVDHLAELAECGGNTVRTWHIEQTEAILDKAETLGLMVCAGLDLGLGRRGFDYRDEARVDEQRLRTLDYVQRRKARKSILFWGLGNELELNYDDTAVWDAVEALAKGIKRIDPNRLLITTVAAVDVAVVNEIAQRCPSVDILGINAYKALDDLAANLQKTSWKRPYIVTEWGGDGAWESKSTGWGAEIEPTSTSKAVMRRERYLRIKGEEQLCLGSFAFLWGQKQEVTPTWYGMFDAEGRAFECVGALRALWGGREASGRWPEIGSLQLNGMDPEEDARVAAGSELDARFDLESLGSGVFEVEVALMEESDDKGIGGDAQRIPPILDLEEARESHGRLAFKAPQKRGAYRLFVYAVCDQKRVASANFPFLVV